MAKADEVQEFRQLCAAGRDISIDGLIRRPEWGTFNFEAARPSLEIAKHLLGSFEMMPVEILPDGSLTALLHAARSVRGRIAAIDKFQIDTGENPRATVESLVQQIRSETDQFLVVASPILPMLAYYRGDIQAQLAKLEDAVKKAQALYTDGEISIATKNKLLDDALAAARNAAAKAGAAVFTQDFLGEAEVVEKTARNWLLGAISLGAAAMFVAIVALLFLQPPTNAPLHFIVQHTITKLVVVGGLITAALWCGSMFKALKHQAATNRHRGNSLKTFQAFIEAAGDQPDVRAAVLLETTRSIFAVAPTGFLNATETNVDGGPKIAETLKAFGRAGG